MFEILMLTKSYNIINFFSHSEHYTALIMKMHERIKARICQ